MKDLSWSKRVAKNIFPRSFEKLNLKLALKEWQYRGQFYDLEAPEADCELCNHQNIRYQFEIQNHITNHKLLVGSECINRFGILGVTDEGVILTANKTKSKVAKDRRKLIEKARKKRIVNSLVELAHKDSDFDILTFLDYECSRGGFTPKQMALLAWRLKEKSITYNLRDYKILLKRSREKVQIIEMPAWKLETISPCLTPAQKTWLAKNRNPA